MGRSPCCDENNGLKKGPWTSEEDQKLVNFITKNGHGSWRALPKLAGLNRCGKSCRLRWTNYLRPDIKRGKFSKEEEQTILNLHSILGNKWSAIASHLPGRTDNEIKNFWNTHLKKKLIQMGFDPMTHQPRTDIFTSLSHLLTLANLNREVMMMDHQLHHHHHQQQHHGNNLNTSSNNMPFVPLEDQEAILMNIIRSSSLSSSTSSSPPIIQAVDPLGVFIQNSLITPHYDHTMMNDSAALYPFSRLPELQIGGSYVDESPPELNDNVVEDDLKDGDDDDVKGVDDLINGLLISHEGNSPESKSMWVVDSSFTHCDPPPPPPPQTAAVMEGGVAATPVWPDLFLEDPLFHEF